MKTDTFVNMDWFVLGAWVVTGGNYAGVMKHVGKAVRDYGVDRNSAPVVCIGIAPWGMVANRTALINPQVPFSTFRN